MSLRLIVVDDSAEYREVVRTLVTSMPEASLVGEARDGTEGLELALRHRPDIVIADLVMPGLSGVDLTARLREQLPGTRVILMSAFTEDAYRLLASDSGADVFISKHVITETLVAAIRDVVRRRLAGGSDWFPPPPEGPAASIGLSP